jgi:hypothetical protein
LVLAASYVRIARTVRWKWAVCAAMVATALVVAALPADLLDELAGHTNAPSAKIRAAFWLTFTAYGALLMISGGVSFWLYLRHAPAPAEQKP